MHVPWLYCTALHHGPVVLDAAEARHATASLRLRPGDAVTLFDGCGHVAHATLLAADPASASRPRRAASQPTVRVATVEAVRPPTHTLTLIVPGCKGDRLDWLVEKCTELGVSRLILADFERSVVHVRQTRLDKLRRTAIEACKQCRRAWLPRIDVVSMLADALAAIAPTPVLVAHPTHSAAALGLWLAHHLPAARALAVVIGPEGGLSDADLNLLQSTTPQLVRLAEHVLRVETAAVAAAAAWAACIPPATPAS